MGGAPSIMVWPNKLVPAELIDVAKRAEAAGFDAVWNVEVDWDSFVYDQAVAMGTARIRSGSGISRSYKRHPLLVAEAASTIDRFAPGRFIIGLGTGPAKRADPNVPLQRWGEDSERPADRLEEYIEVIRLALSGEPVIFTGEFYAVEDVQLEHVPAGPVPIYLAAGGPRLCRLAGRVADGAFLIFLNHKGAKEWAGLIRKAAADAGRDPGSTQISRVIPVCVDADGEAARRALRRHLFFPYFTLPYYHRLLVANGFPEVSEQIQTRLAADGIDAAAEAISDDALDSVTIAGEPEVCRERVAEFEDGDFDNVVYYPFPVDDEDWAAGYAAAVDVFATSWI